MIRGKVSGEASGEEQEKHQEKISIRSREEQEKIGGIANGQGIAKI